jgi:hypothetical protein
MVCNPYDLPVHFVNRLCAVNVQHFAVCLHRANHRHRFGVEGVEASSYGGRRIVGTPSLCKSLDGFFIGKFDKDYVIISPCGFRPKLINLGDSNEGAGQ